MTTTMSSALINDCGEKPGQLIKLMRAAKSGELMDCKARSISRSMGKDGIVFTMNVNTAKAPMAANRDTWNRNVRYSRFGLEVTSFFAACWAASFTFSTGFSLVVSDILSFLLHTVLLTPMCFWNRGNWWRKFLRFIFLQYC